MRRTEQNKSFINDFIFRSNSKDIQNMNRRMIVPPDQTHQHHYNAGINPIQPFSYARQQPTPPRKSIQHDTDVYVDLKRRKINSFFFFK